MYNVFDFFILILFFDQILILINYKTYLLSFWCTSNRLRIISILYLLILIINILILLHLLIVLKSLIKMVLIIEIFLKSLIFRAIILPIEQVIRSCINKLLRINIRLWIILRNQIILIKSRIILDSVIMRKISGILNIQRYITLYLIYAFLVVRVCRSVSWSVEIFWSIYILEIHPFI